MSVISFLLKLFFFEFGLMYCDLWCQYMTFGCNKLKCGNYSRVENICGSMVVEILVNGKNIRCLGFAAVCHTKVQFCLTKNFSVS